MTMILGAIAWLTDRRARIDQAIETLQQLAGETSVGAAPPPAHTPSRTMSGTPVKTKTAPSGRVPQRPQAGSTAHQIAQFLKRKGPQSPREIRQAAKMTSSQVGHALKVLSDRKLVTSTGQTNDRRYQLAPDFDVIWSGAAERAGDAPSLLGDRPQRSAS